MGKNSGFDIRIRIALFASQMTILVNAGGKMIRMNSIKKTLEKKAESFTESDDRITKVRRPI